jgi:hypothetical protein
MMGHIVDETSSSYFVPTKAGVREQYEKVVDHLAVQEVEVTKVVDQTLKEMKEKLLELEEKVGKEQELREKAERDLTAITYGRDPEDQIW